MIKAKLDRDLVVGFVNKETNPQVHHESELELMHQLREIVKEADRESAFEERDWETGFNHIIEEGTSFWEKLRLDKGLTREKVEDMTEGVCLLEEQMMFENRPGLPTTEQIVALARVYEMTPGELLDLCFEDYGREIRKEHEAEVVESSVSKKL